MSTWPDLLQRALADAPGRPRLTWYGADGERVELSGAVTWNWAVKSANLLVDELDVEPGAQIRLDLPMHWRTVVWAVAVWLVGGTVRLDDPAAPDVLVTDRPRPGVAGQVAVALPALARHVPGLPPGAVDAAVATFGQPDLPLLRCAPPDDGDALVGPGKRLTYGELVHGVGPDPGRRLRVAAPSITAADLEHVAALLAAGGSIVLLHPHAPAATPGPIRDRLVATERIDIG